MLTYSAVAETSAHLSLEYLLPHTESPRPSTASWAVHELLAKQLSGGISSCV